MRPCEKVGIDDALQHLNKSFSPLLSLNFLKQIKVYGIIFASQFKSAQWAIWSTEYFEKT